MCLWCAGLPASICPANGSFPAANCKALKALRSVCREKYTRNCILQAKPDNISVTAFFAYPSGQILLKAYFLALVALIIDFMLCLAHEVLDEKAKIF